MAHLRGLAGSRVPERRGEERSGLCPGAGLIGRLEMSLCSVL